MPTLENFLGINNVQQEERLQPGELTEASNCYVNNENQLRHREGFAIAASGIYKNVFHGPDFMLATKGASGDLVAIDYTTGIETTLQSALGHDRVWYAALPDGRVAFSNSSVSRITNAAGTSTTQWGVPIPAGVGTASNIVGALNAGQYRYRLTHVRAADGLEGGPAYSSGTVNLTSGGLRLTGLPTLSGHGINVYLTGRDGTEGYLAATLGAGVSSVDITTVANKDLTQQCKTDHLYPAPTGARLCAFWRGRALLAAGPVLYASRPHQWEHFDFARDIKQFPKDITLVQPVAGGIFVGTDEELGFMEGVTFDALAYSRRVAGAVVLGSGVAVAGENIVRGKGRASGDSMICIAGNCITAGYADGAAVQLTKDRYTTDVAEVAAAFREVDGTPQYIAIEQ